MQEYNSQNRLLLATGLSFLFFIAYSYFYLEPKAKLAQEAQQAQELANKQNKTQTYSNQQSAISKQAPQINQKVNSANTNLPSTLESANDFISTIQTKKHTFYIDNLGRISQVVLKDKVQVDSSGKHIKVLNPNKTRALEIRFSNAIVNAKAFKVDYKTSATNVDATSTQQTITLSQDLGDVKVTKTLTFYPDGHYNVDIQVSDDEVFYVTNGYRADVIADMYADHGALLYNAQNTREVITDGSVDSVKTYNNINIVSAFDRYYASVLYAFDTPLSVTILKEKNSDDPLAFIYAKKQISLQGYIGAKDYKTLKALNPKLTNIIEYGFFTFLAQPMFLLLQLIYSFVGNWGWTIVFTTILIKFMLFPLAYKGMMSMNRLKELAPKIKDIQEKHKDDKQKASMAMMELYKKENVNPMGGCLPILLQIPVFFAIYRVLTNAIELKGSEWILWIDDLAAMDPYFVLPILMGVSMYVQQKIQPNQIQDEMQKKIFQYLPVIFTVFFLWFPAGLTLYWLINNLFTIAQQYYINTIFEKAKQAREAQKTKQKAKNK